MTADIHPDAGAVGGIDLMKALPPAVLGEVAAAARQRHVAIGTRIFDQGDHAGRAHALLSGCVRITQSGSDGAEILVRLIGPGEIFGCVPILTDRLYPGDAKALADSVELSWDARELLALMERFSSIAINMTAVIGKRLSETQERLRELATQSTDRRIAHTLLRLIDQAGERDGAGGTRIAFPLRRKDIADITGTTLHTVSRVLSGWERHGLLVSDKPYLTILRPQELRGIAEGAI